MDNKDDTKIGGLYYDIDAPNDKLNASIDKSDKKVKEFGDNAGLTGEQVRAGFNKAALGLGAVGATFTILAKNATDFTKSAVADAKGLAREIGTTTTEASRLTAAFGRVGVSADQARASFGIFSKNIASSTENAEANRLAIEKLKIQIDATKREITETSDEIKKNGDKSGDLNLRLRALNNTLQSQQEELGRTSGAFEKLGVSTRNADGRQKDFRTILFEVADKFKEMPDGIDKTALALELFGRSGKDMIRVLNLGSEGIEELEKKADELGLTLNEKTINRIAELNKSQKDLKEQTDSLKIAIGTATAPILTEFNKKLNEVLMSILGTEGPMRDLTATFIAFAGPVATGIAGVVAFGANLVQLWPAITKVTAALTSMTAVSIVGWAGLAAAAIASIGFAIYETDKAIDKFKKDWEDLSKQKVSVNNNPNIQVSKTSDVGIIQQFRNFFSGFATGTDFAPGGWSMVGERGPELAYVPRGSQIIPNDQSRNIVNNLNNPKSSTMISMPISIGEIRNRSDADYLVRQIDINQRRVLRGVSPA